VLSVVLDAVRAEAFNEKRTLFLFGSYTIGKEKLFLEVARTLKKKVHCCHDEFVVCGMLCCLCAAIQSINLLRTGLLLVLDALLKPLYMVTASANWALPMLDGCDMKPDQICCF